MSALEMTANGERISGGAAQKIDEAIDHLTTAQQVLRDLQDTVDSASCREDMLLTPQAIWHRLETIDDRIHDALSKLGN